MTQECAAQTLFFSFVFWRLPMHFSPLGMSKASLVTVAFSL